MEILRSEIKKNYLQNNQHLQRHMLTKGAQEIDDCERIKYRMKTKYFEAI